jgi:hypothetical protein
MNSESIIKDSKIRKLVKKKYNGTIAAYNGEIKLIENYIYTTKLNIDTDVLKSSCDKMYEIIKENFSENKQNYIVGQTTITTKLYTSYNLFLYPLPEFDKLFKEIRSIFFSLTALNTNGKPENIQYYMQCWLNYYNKGDFIDWHSHWRPEKKTWHGFYCLDCEPSFTSYRIPSKREIINVTSEKNLVVISKTDGDKHKSSAWLDESRPRITIAFDIVPMEFIDSSVYYLNHWIPL